MIDSFSSKVQELVHYRYLLQNLVVRDLKVRYKNSVLGVVWSLLNPLMMMIVFSLVFTIALGEDGIRQYAVFILVGLIPWNFFSSAVQTGTMSILSNATLVKKIYFPRELLTTSAVMVQLVNFGLSFLILLIFLYGSGIGLTIHALWVPLILLTQIIFTLGIALLLSAVNVFYRDVMMILDFTLLALFFLTPIVYPLDNFGPTTTLLGITFDPAVVMRWINPMASIVDGYRTVLWGTMTSTGPVSMFPPYLLRTFVTSLIVFCIGYIVFLRTEYWFGEKL